MARPLEPGTRALVTGGAGFIGSHLVERLAARGCAVTVLDDLSTGSEKNLAQVAGRFELIASDVEDALRGNAVGVEDYAYVFHLAANPYIPRSVEDPERDFRSNLSSTMALLEAVRRASRRPLVLLASSAAVYGNPSRLPIREDDPTVPISPYGVSKLGAERYVAVYAEIYGLAALSLRLFSVYGPRQRKQVVYDMMRKLERDPTGLEVIGDGTQERDLTYVTDTAEAMLLAATRAPARGEALNVATGTSLTVAQLVESVAAACGARPQVRYTGRTRPGDAERWRVDISAISGLGFVPRTSLEEGLRAVKEWLGRG